MSSDDRPDWMKDAGLGLEADMTGDPTPGSGGSLRFWLPKGSDRKVIFLTEGNKAPVLFEHRIRLGGSWNNWFTCLSHLGMECPLCKFADENDGNGRRKKVMYFTVIDTHEFEDRSGKKRKNLKKLFAAQKDTTEILKRQYLKRLEAEQGLRGAMFDIFRTKSDKSASVGEQFDFIKMVDLSSLPDSEEFDYKELLKPDIEKVRLAVERLRREGGMGAGDKEPDDEGTDAKVTY